MNYRLIGMDKEFHNRFKDSIRTDVNGLYLVSVITICSILFVLFLL